MKFPALAMVWSGAILAISGPSGCSVGKGVGAASGTLFEYGCSQDGDYCSTPGVCGSQAASVPYDLKPSFFAGEPIDDLREHSAGSAIMNNRLTIRLQRSGKQIELNDVLTFDITTSYEVARCVRGRVDKDTGNDWDEANCFRASDTGPGRMRVQFDSPVRAALTLKATCTANLVASAVSAPVPLSYSATPKPVVTDGSWDSWVEFQEFGSAAQVNTPPQERTPIDGKFRVELGDRIYATSFALTLVDDQVVTAAIKNLPKPAASIGATLGGDRTTGRFDFDLERGQGAQFFP
ncbi:MAG TPA: hypothetical protein VF550_13965 [Polyangia bacterium]